MADTNISIVKSIAEIDDVIAREHLEGLVKSRPVQIHHTYI